MRWSPAWWLDFLDASEPVAADSQSDISATGIRIDTGELGPVVAEDTGPCLPKGSEPLTIGAALDMLHADIATYGEPYGRTA